MNSLLYFSPAMLLLAVHSDSNVADKEEYFCCADFGPGGLCGFYGCSLLKNRSTGSDGTCNGCATDVRVRPYSNGTNSSNSSQ